MAMTREEHQLIIQMLAKQVQTFHILLDLLQEQKTISLENFAQIERTRRTDLGLNYDALHAVTAEYRAGAAKLGIALPPEDESISDQK